MYIILGLISMDVLAKGYILLILAFLALLCYDKVKNKKIIRMNVMTSIIILFSVMLFAISRIYDKDSVYLLVAPFLAFYIGRLVIILNENNEKYFTKCIYAIILGTFIHAMLNFIISRADITRKEHN